MAEAQFLESSKARTERLREKHEHIRQSAETRTTFWTSVRSYLDTWSQRLNELVELHRETVSLSEDEKQLINLALCRLKDELSDLKRKCLSSHVAVTENSSTNPLPSVPDDLPFGDLRLLHDELKRHQDKLNKVKLQLLPKGKFVFKRYRQVVEQLRQEGKELYNSNDVSTVTVDVDLEEQKERSTEEEECMPNTICNLAYVSIVVDESGTICIESLLASSGDRNEEESERCISMDGAVVLKNISHSTISLHGMYSALYILHLEHTSVTIHDRIVGSIHVTDCRVCTIHGTSQQVRLHDSTDLTLWIGGAAAILEDCRRICFQYDGSHDEHTLPNVKDFSFLKEGEASPNYTLERVSINSMSRETENTAVQLHPMDSSGSDDQAVRNGQQQWDTESLVIEDAQEGHDAEEEDGGDDEEEEEL